MAFFPSPIEVVQFHIPRVALEEFVYENRIAMANTIGWPHCEMATTLKHLGMAVLSAIQRSEPAPTIFLDYIGHTILAHATYVVGELQLHQVSSEDTWLLGRRDARKSS